MLDGGGWFLGVFFFEVAFLRVWLIDYFIEHSCKSLEADYVDITTLIYWETVMYLPIPSSPYYLLGRGAFSGLALSISNVCIFVSGFLSQIY